MDLSADQTPPSVFSGRLAPPIVYDLTLDTNFDAVASEHGPISFALTTSSRARIPANMIEGAPQGRIHPRVSAEEQEHLARRAFVARNLQGMHSL